MKARGLFGFMAATMLALRSFARDTFKGEGRNALGSGKYRNRDAFMSVSVPRCHTQKKIYKGFAR
jgi:hypothetical protein